MADGMGVSGWSGVLGTWVSIVGVFGGGFAALSTYSEEVAKMEDARVVQTFDLFEMFNGSELLRARQRILDAATGRTDGYAGHDLWLTLDFYDALQACVERNLCDQDLAVRLFQPYAVPIWQGMSSDIVGGRTASDPNMGAGIEWIAALHLSASQAEEEVDAAGDPQGPAAASMETEVVGAPDD